MDCAQARDLVTRLVSGNAGAAEQGALEAHLASCAECDGLHSRFSRTWDLMGRLGRVSLPAHKSRATADRVRRRASWTRFRPAAIGAAAALLLAVGVWVLFRSPAPVPAPAVVVEEKPEPAADPVQEQEAVRAQALLTSISEERRDPAPTAPVPPPAQDSVNPAPAPVPAPPVQEPKVEPAVPTQPPAPDPPAPVAPAVRESALAHVATLERVQGDAFLLHEGARTPAKAGQKILATQGLEAAGQAVVEYPDGTRLVLGAESAISSFHTRPAAGKVPAGRVVALARGVLAAQVARQAAGEQMAFLTPHGEARVVGTRLTLSVSSAATLLEVTEGKVRLFRAADGASAEVTAGHYAVAGAKGAPMAARVSAPKRVALAENFDRGRWSQDWVQQVESGSAPRFGVQTGALSLRFPRQAPAEVTPAGIGPTEQGKVPPDVGQKAIDSVMQGVASKGEWPRSTWLETRRAFPLSADAPLRIHARLWQSHADPDRTSWVAINRKSASQIVLERRGDLLQLWAAGQAAVLFKAERSCTQETEVVELWITPDRIILRQNDVTLHSGTNPVKARSLQLSLGGGAKASLGQDEEVRFDDVEVALMTQADLAKILK